MPCEGSTTTGRCDSRLRMGTAFRSRVLRVMVSKVRIPRSQRITCLLPRETMYSAAMSSSLMVLLIPRLSSTGLRRSPTASSSEKFCMLRAPICRRSAASATSGNVSVSFTSVTTLSPVSDRAWESSSRPLPLSPWKSYGLVRGLKAPPRSKLAPLCTTPRAAARICCSLSTAHGPAITTSSRPPIGTPATSTTVSSCFTSRETSLYGAVTGMHSATPFIKRKCPGSMGPLLPVMPMAVRPAPSIACGVNPSSRTRASMAACCSGVTSVCRTISMYERYRRSGVDSSW